MRNASVALSALLLAGASAMAQAPAPAPGNGANPCADDARRLCKGVQPGEGRIDEVVCYAVAVEQRQVEDKQPAQTSETGGGSDH